MVKRRLASMMSSPINRDSFGINDSKVSRIDTLHISELERRIFKAIRLEHMVVADQETKRKTLEPHFENMSLKGLFRKDIFENNNDYCHALSCLENFFKAVNARHNYQYFDI